MQPVLQSSVCDRELSDSSKYEALYSMYALVLIFAPALLHRSPDQVGGAIQVGVAFGLGWLLDRALSAVHRRRARAEDEG